ncbi:hypothetical protein PPERSA_08752 [Pseudocohnilembus persalinus]|uniref:Calpain catalytic domain-containing protein n=1 Tax=Pseudocohnilembus persalinus TaxID=266149 RepID=A0A0V0R7I3_PSEPJ|nr:hypothetical protein PPERSA_08752 [Pseudocohnilembus persalinus]|eukprot:KRX10450.1 hypothetical protein PPERSA_08752 [Pseudocohnilembus persalinus]
MLVVKDDQNNIQQFKQNQIIEISNYGLILTFLLMSSRNYGNQKKNQLQQKNYTINDDVNGKQVKNMISSESKSFVSSSQKTVLNMDLSDKFAESSIKSVETNLNDQGEDYQFLSSYLSSLVDRDDILPKNRNFDNFQKLPLQDPKSREFSMYSNDLFKMGEEERKIQLNEEQKYEKNLKLNQFENIDIGQNQQTLFQKQYQGVIREKKAYEAFQFGACPEEQSDVNQKNKTLFGAVQRVQEQKEGPNLIKNENQQLDLRKSKFNNINQPFGINLRIPSLSENFVNQELDFNSNQSLKSQKEEQRFNPLINFSILNKQSDKNKQKSLINIENQQFQIPISKQEQSFNIMQSGLFDQNQNSFISQNITNNDKMHEERPDNTFILKEDLNETQLSSIFEETVRGSRKNRSNLFKNGGENLNLLNMGQQLDQFDKNKDRYIISNLWEDIGVSQNDNRFKSLKLAESGLLNEEKCLQMIKSYNKEEQNLFCLPVVQLQEQNLIQNICYMFLGVDGELFCVNQEEQCFFWRNSNVQHSLKHITAESLRFNLNVFFVGATYVYRLNQLKLAYEGQRNKEKNLKEIFGVLENYFQYMNEVVLKVQSHKNLTLLELGAQLRVVINQIQLIYEILFYNYHQSLNMDNKNKLSNQKQHQQQNNQQQQYFTIKEESQNKEMEITPKNKKSRLIQLNQLNQYNQNLQQYQNQRNLDFDQEENIFSQERFDLQLALQVLPNQNKMLEILFEYLKFNTLVYYDFGSIFLFFQSSLQPLLFQISRFSLEGVWEEGFFEIELKNQNFAQNYQDSMRVLLLVKFVGEKYFEICVNNQFGIKIGEEFLELKQYEKQFSQFYEQKQQQMKTVIEEIRQELEKKQQTELQIKKEKVREIKKLYKKQREEEQLQRQIKETEKRKQLLKFKEDALNYQKESQLKKQLKIEEEKALLLEQELQEREKQYQEQQMLIEKNQQLIEEEKIIILKNEENIKKKLEERGKWKEQQNNKQSMKSLLEMEDLNKQNKEEGFLKEQYLKIQEEQEKLIQQKKEEDREEIAQVKKMYEEKNQHENQQENKMEEENIIVEQSNQQKQRQEKTLLELYEEKMKGIQEQIKEIYNEDQMQNQNQEIDGEKEKLKIDQRKFQLEEEIVEEEDFKGFRKNEERQIKDFNDDELNKSVDSEKFDEIIKKRKNSLQYISEDDEEQQNKKYIEELNQRRKMLKKQFSLDENLVDLEKYNNYQVPIQTLIEVAIKKPLAIHNKAINGFLVGLVFEKFQLLQILKFMKGYFLCYKGEKIDEFVSYIVLDNNTINKLGLLAAAQNLFDENDYTQSKYDGVKKTEFLDNFQIIGNSDLEKNHINLLNKGIFNQDLDFPIFDFSSKKQQNIDINDILSNCKIAETEFNDSEFPGQNQKMTRIIEKIKNNEKEYKLFGEISSESVVQGSLGDCYLISSIGVLSENPFYITRLFRNKQFNQFGAYQVLMSESGKFKKILLDDCFPCNNYGGILFCQPKNGNIYGMLLEKSYAKLYGGYNNISVGFSGDALKDLTGAPFDYIEIQKQPQEGWNQIREGLNKQFVLTASSKENSQNMNNKHCYGILQIKEINYQGKKYKFVQIRNPHGYTGGSQLIEKLPQNVVQQLNEAVVQKGGLLWMYFEDFIKNFEVVTVSKVYNGYSYSYLSYESGNENKTQQKTHFSLTSLYCHQDSQAYISVHQKHKRFFDESYQYKTQRVIVFSIKNGKIDTVLGGDHNCKQSCYIEVYLQKNTQYFIYGEIDTLSQSYNSDFTISCYSKIPVSLQNASEIIDMKKVNQQKLIKYIILNYINQDQYQNEIELKCKKTGAQFLKKYCNQNEISDLDNGVIRMYNTLFGFVYIAYMNQYENSVFFENINSFPVFENLFAYSENVTNGQKIQVQVQPKNQEVILFRLGNQNNCSHKISFSSSSSFQTGIGNKNLGNNINNGQSQNNENLVNQALKQGNCKQRVTGVNQYTLKHQEGFIIVYQNQSKKTYKEDLTFKVLDNLVIQPQNAQNLTNKTVKIQIKPLENYYILLRFKNPGNTASKYSCSFTNSL